MTVHLNDVKTHSTSPGKYRILSESTLQEVQQLFNGCRLCWALSKFGQRYPTNSILYSTNDCKLIPALGSLSKGYVLMVSKEHLGAFATLTHEVLTRIENQLNDVIKMIEGKFSGLRWVAFEHGTTVKHGIKACCVDHFHIHILPCQLDLVEKLKAKLGITPIRLSSLKFLPEKVSKSGSNYLLVRKNDGQNYLFLSKEYPSQYIRQIVAAHLGMSRKWNWFEYPLESTALSTIKLFKEKKLTPGSIYFAHGIEGIKKEEIKKGISCVRDYICSRFAGVKVESMYEIISKEIIEELGITSDILPEFLVETERRYLESCDLMLVDLSKKNWQYVGALMEIVYAASAYIPVIAITGESTIRERLWLSAHVNQFSDNLENAMKAIMSFL